MTIRAKLKSATACNSHKIESRNPRQQHATYSENAKWREESACLHREDEEGRRRRKEDLRACYQLLVAAFQAPYRWKPLMRSLEWFFVVDLAARSHSIETLTLKPLQLK